MVTGWRCHDRRTLRHQEGAHGATAGPPIDQLEDQREATTRERRSGRPSSCRAGFTLSRGSPKILCDRRIDASDKKWRSALGGDRTTRYRPNPPREGRAWPAALLSGLLALGFLAGGCGGQTETQEEVAPAPELPNPFSELRPRAGDVLVPPQIGFRWVLTGAEDASDDPAALRSGEFSVDSGAVVANGDDSETTEEPDEDVAEASDASDMADDQSGGSADPGGRDSVDQDDDPPELPEGDTPSELERVDAYPNGDPPPRSVEIPKERLFRVVMVDSIGAIYANVVTAANSIRVPLPPHTEPGRYEWHVELLTASDSTVVAQSERETFEIR